LRCKENRSSHNSKKVYLVRKHTYMEFDHWLCAERVL
jgi:hypothetical protein